MLNHDGRRARARLAAHKRWHPGDDLDQVTHECLAELETANDDEWISELADRAPRMTAAQLARLRKLANATDGASEA